MASLGANAKLIAPNSARDPLRHLFAEVLGCGHRQVADKMDIYAFADGGHIGIAFVDDPAALSPEQHRRAGTWLEFCVDDVAATTTALVAAGLSVVPYVDESHVYFAAPGGQVFRLAAR